jgi:hypothetical protein
MQQFAENRISAIAEYQLGKLFFNPTQSGTKGYLYCQMDASGTTGDGFVCLIDAATFTASIMATTAAAAPGTGTGKLVGVCRAIVPASNFCWLQVFGIGNVQVLASAVLYTRLNTTVTSGALDDDAAVGSRVINGVTLTATRAASQGNAVGVLNFPEVGVTL